MAFHSSSYLYNGMVAGFLNFMYVPEPFAEKGRSFRVFAVRPKECDCGREVHADGAVGASPASLLTHMVAVIIETRPIR